jgi:DNA repair protein RadC
MVSYVRLDERPLPCLTKDDDHDSSRVTVPTHRPHPKAKLRKATFRQLDRRRAMLMHNHPSGGPRPSQADIHMTETIIETAKPLGIAMPDNIIVDRNEHAVLKGQRPI